MIISTWRRTGPSHDDFRIQKTPAGRILTHNDPSAADASAHATVLKTVVTQLLFGYNKVHTDPGSPVIAAALYPEGMFVFQAKGPKSGSCREVAFRISEDCLNEISEMITMYSRQLRQYAKEINGTCADFEHENHFTFGDQKIIDWDLARWYLEEDREKHPEYYSNSRKVELTENYVRAIFDEICRIIEQDTKEMQYIRAYCADL